MTDAELDDTQPRYSAKRLRQEVDRETKALNESISGMRADLAAADAKITDLQAERDAALGQLQAMTAVVSLLEKERDAALAGAVRVRCVENVRKTFPILSGGGARIDYALVKDHGEQAQRNHYQSIERLAERGGLSWEELHAVLHNGAFKKIDRNAAIVECRAIEARYLAALEPDPERLAAWQDVLAERKRQISAEGWTPEHDDAHTCGELAQAAAVYALLGTGVWSRTAVEYLWPRTWAKGWLKYGPLRRMLVKAGALILAEIERLDRAAAALKGGAA